MIQDSPTLANTADEFDVTVIVAVRNGVDTLEACLTSILNQEDLRIAVIVVDGGSTDGTGTIIERYHSRLFLDLKDTGQGVYRAWNQALVHAHSPWIAFLGCDDSYADKRALAKLVSAARHSNHRPVFVYSKVSQRDANGHELMVLGQPWDIARAQLPYRMSICHCGSIHARELFNGGNFDTSFRIVGDYEFLYRQLKWLRAEFVNEALVIARVGGLSTRPGLAIAQKLELRRIYKMHKASLFIRLRWYLSMSATLASLVVVRILRINQ